MKVSSIIKFNQEHFLKYAHKHATIIDATLGNGHDTFFLATNFNRALIYGFDIQQQAIENSKNKNAKFTNITYIHDGHEHMKNYITKQVDLIVFNLGYLPNSNTDITTTSSSTIQAIKAGSELLKKSGGIIITIYTGHDKHEEEIEIINYITSLNKYEYNVIKYQFVLLYESPYTIIIEKK